MNREGGGPPRPRMPRGGGLGTKGGLGDFWGRLPLRKGPWHCSGRSSGVGSSGGQALLSNPKGCLSSAGRHRAPWGWVWLSAHAPGPLVLRARSEMRGPGSEVVGTMRDISLSRSPS